MTTICIKYFVIYYSITNLINSASQVFSRGGSVNPIAIEKQYSFNLGHQFPVVAKRGQGVYLWDDQGRRYIDCIGGAGGFYFFPFYTFLFYAISYQTKPKNIKNW